jgi:hypothetical protein
MQASVNSNNTASNTRFAPSWHYNDNDSQEFEHELVINVLMPMGMTNSKDNIQVVMLNITYLPYIGLNITLHIIES